MSYNIQIYHISRFAIQICTYIYIYIPCRYVKSIPSRYIISYRVILYRGHVIYCRYSMYRHIIQIDYIDTVINHIDILYHMDMSQIYHISILRLYTYISYHSTSFIYIYTYHMHIIYLLVVCLRSGVFLCELAVVRMIPADL